MHVTYLVITILAALATGYAAFLNFVGAESVKVVADRRSAVQPQKVPVGSQSISSNSFAISLVGSAYG
jgi:hypothetical protein